MPAGDLITGDWQIEWGGILLGSADFGITEVVGLADLPGVITADRDRLRSHGSIAGDDFLVGRTVEIGLRVEGTDPFANVALLAASTMPGSAESPLVFRIPGIAGGRKARLGARCRARSVPTGLEFVVGAIAARLQFFATDPRIYDAVDTVASVLLPSGGGGLDVDVVLPATLNAQTQSGAMFVANDGNFAAPWSARIDGPCLNPIIRNVTDGTFLGFTIDLAAGEWLDIDTSGARAVTLNGTTSRYYTIQPGSTWWDFAPGTTELAFRASTTTAAQLTVTSRSAWTA